MVEHCLYKKIETAARESEVSKLLLQEIKTFSKANAHKKYNHGELTKIVLEKILKDFDENKSNFGILIKVKVLELLKKEPIFEISLKC